MINIKITDNESNQRLDRFLRKLFKKLPLTEIYKMIRKGKIKVNKVRKKESYMLQTGDLIDIYIDEVLNGNKLFESDKSLNIIYEDKNILIIEKPAGLLSHPQSAKDRDTLIQRVLGYLKGTKEDVESYTFSPALCNRLDRNTAGLVIAAKNYDALKKINEMLRQRDIERFYLCIVKGKTKSEGVISNVISKDKSKRKAYLEKNMQGACSETRYLRLTDNGDYSLLKVELVTGRFHQIRAHLSGIGHPIIGDNKYGVNETNEYFKKYYNLHHQFLMSYILRFKNPHESLGYLRGMAWQLEIPENYRIIIKDLFGDCKV